MKGHPHRVFLTCLFLAAQKCLLSARAESLDLSPTALVAAKDGKVLYVACETAGLVLAFDPESEKVTARYPVAQVSGLALSPGQERLFATAGGFSGTLHEIDLTSGKTLRTLPAGHTPESPVLGADGKTLYYCNRFSRADQKDIHALDVTTGKVTHSAKAIREPSTMRLSKDGKTLWVGNALPLMPANSQRVYASLCLYDSATLEKVATLDLPGGPSVSATPR